MRGNRDIGFTKDSVTEAIEHNARVINLMILLVVFTLLFVIVRFLHTVLDYIPMDSVITMLSIVACLMIISTFMIQSTSQKGVKALNGYVDELNELMDSMQEKEKKYSCLFQHSNDGIFIQDHGGNILDVNQKMLDMVGEEKSGFLSLKMFDLYPPKASEKAMNAFYQLQKEGHLSFEMEFMRKNGEVFPVEVSSNVMELGGGKVIQCIVRDTTERKRMEEQLRSISITDELTGLLNRRGFLTLSKQQMKIASRSGRGMFLLFVDIDCLKDINDRLGHHEGDLALIETGSFLRKNVRDSDIVSRLGGDEFVVLMVDITDSVAGDIVVSRLNERLKALNAQEGRHYTLNISFGLVYHDPGSGQSIEELVKRADKAMYEHKRAKMSNQG